MHVKENTHWYAADGTPVYEVPRADGSGMRPATLADARKLSLYPGVTSIIKCAAAPGLENWKQNQVMLAALTLPRLPGELDEAFCKRVLVDSGEQARRARERGTEIHAAIQGHYEGKPPSVEMFDYVRGAVRAIRENFGEHKWVSERPCSHQLGYGTKADLHCTEPIVLDFKGADFTAKEIATLKTWDEHAMQLAATREALNLPHAECAIVYVSRTTPGLCRVIRMDEDEIQRGWAMFQALLAFWQHRNKHWPYRQREAA